MNSLHEKVNWYDTVMNSNNAEAMDLLNHKYTTIEIDKMRISVREITGVSNYSRFHDEVEFSRFSKKSVEEVREMSIYEKIDVLAKNSYNLIIITHHSDMNYAHCFMDILEEQIGKEKVKLYKEQNIILPHKQRRELLRDEVKPIDFEREVRETNLEGKRFIGFMYTPFRSHVFRKNNIDKYVMIQINKK